MSWELVSFLIVVAVVIGGFAWYERSRPPAQVVALVAALAALAIAGRVAFAAFPNVKPTTDIVIFAGYALGGAPGFAVGALTALVSNLWFGQGPWTPWQMAGWGLCGVLGAALALGGRTPNRYVLALFCAFAGILYGALLNFSLMATYGGELSLARFGVLEARAIPFDAAHAAANAALALVAGPAMLRMLTRFRLRFEWKRADLGDDPTGAAEGGAADDGGGRLRPALRGGGIAALLALALLLGAARPPDARADSPASAADWLAGVQKDDGGWGSSPGDSSDPAMTAWSMLGLEAAGRNPLDVANGGSTPVDYLRRKAGSLKSPGSLALAILALGGAGVDPRDLAGRNLVAELLDRRGSNGSYQGWPGVSSYAVLALRSAGADPAAAATADWLRKVQNDDGGWGDLPSSPSTADGTGAAMMALAGSKAAQRGITFLKRLQRPNGGFPLGAGGTVNTQSTAWAVQGIIAAGGDPGGLKRGGSSPLDYLAANQDPDGHYRYATPGGGTSKLVAEQTPIWATGQVLAAVTGSTYPIAAVARAPKPKAPSGSPGPSSSESAGGLPPSAFAPEPAPELGETLPESSESLPEPISPTPQPGTGPGVSPGQAVPGKGPKGSGPGSAGAAPPGGGAPSFGEAGAEPAPATGAEDDASPDGTSDGGDASGTSGIVGAGLTGLLAGCLIFGAGWLGRRGWMHWRYGL